MSYDEEISETTRVEAIERFHVAFDAFYRAGMALVEAWDDPDAVFNADIEWPLPERIAPPMSLDEWLDELHAHYYPEEEDLPDFDTVEAAGLDGTLRGEDGRPIGEAVTWREIAETRGDEV